MGKAFDKVVATQADLLDVQEHYLAAGGGQERTPRIGIGVQAPSIKGVKLPLAMVWAVSDRRMFIWAADKLTGATPKRMLLVLDLGREVTLVGVGRGTMKSTLAIMADGDRVQVSMLTEDAEAIAGVIANASSTVLPAWLTPVDPSAGDSRAGGFISALQQSDWPAAAEAYRGLKTVHEREFFSYLVTHVPGRPPGFDAWVGSEPGSAAAHLFRGAHSIDWAWGALAARTADAVDKEPWQVFYSRLRAAERDLRQAADLDRSDPSPWTHLLVSGRGLHIPIEELEMRFDEADRRAPASYYAHREALQGLCQKWGGSSDRMFGFARAKADAAGDGSVVHSLVPMAHLECWRVAEGDDQTGYFADADVQHEIVEHAGRSVLHPTWVDAPHTVEAENVFAAVLRKCRQWESAQLLAQRIGSRRSEFPWSYFKDPAGFFREATMGVRPRT